MSISAQSVGAGTIGGAASLRLAQLRSVSTHRTIRPLADPKSAPEPR